MKSLLYVIKFSSICWLCSTLVSFVLALIAYWQSGITPVLGNAISVATTGGFSGAPLNGLWRFAVLIPGTVYAISGWVLLPSVALFFIIKLLQVFLGLFGKRVNLDSIQNT